MISRPPSLQVHIYNGSLLICVCNTVSLEPNACLLSWEFNLFTHCSWIVEVRSYPTMSPFLFCPTILKNGLSLCVYSGNVSTAHKLFLSLSSFLFLCLSHEVHILQKSWQRACLTASRSASQSLQLSYQPCCVTVASVYVCGCLCAHVCNNSMASLWQIYISQCTFNNSITGPVSSLALGVIMEQG